MNTRKTGLFSPGETKSEREELLHKNMAEISLSTGVCNLCPRKAGVNETQKAECSLQLAKFKKWAIQHIAGKLEFKDHFHFICSNNPYSELPERSSGITI